MLTVCGRVSRLDSETAGDTKCAEDNDDIPADILTEDAEAGSMFEMSTPGASIDLESTESCPRTLRRFC